MIGLLVVLLAWAASAAAQVAPERLTIEEAEQIALKNHPAIAAAQLTADASEQRIAQAQAARQPFVTASVTGAGAPEGSRIAAGALNNPVIYSRVATGVSVNQMLFDFGRTSRLVDSSKYTAQAEEERVSVTRAGILLEVRTAFYAALRAAALVRVAEHTVAARQLIADQVSELVKAQLKSSLDASFAQTSVAEAKLLVAQARNEREAALANLAQAMGTRASRPWELAEQPLPPVEPLVLSDLVDRAMRERPELAAARLQTSASSSLAAAERASRFPAVSATAGGGVVPTHVEGLRTNYAAVGINISLPFLNGGLFKARQREAELLASATGRRLQDLENRIVRDVSLALLDVNFAAERITLTQQFVEQAAQSMELAQARYDLGLSSIVELSQAQLVKTNAEIQFTSARYEYQSRRDVLNHRIGLLK